MDSEPAYYVIPRHWRFELAILSFVVSFLGAYTTTQLAIQASSTKRTGRAMFWLALASVSFGGTGIWCMHFVAMLAIDIGLEKRYEASTTIATALSAIFGTFLTLLINVPPPERSTVSKRSRVWHLVHGVLTRRFWGSMLKRRQSVGYDSLERADSAFDESEQSQPYDSRSDQQSSTLDSDSIGREMDLRDHRPGTARFRSYKMGDLLQALWQGCTIRILVSGALLGFDVFLMHFLGMRAMKFDGIISYNMWFVLLSYLEACFASVVAIIYMPLESDINRQLVFSVVAAIAVSGLHYIGMLAATFKTTVPPPYSDSPVNYTLAASCAAIAITTCFISYAFLAHAVADHKIRLQGYIQTRKELWKATAERRAFERSNRLKSDFIATASHELRTPLYSISGYSELLQTTNLNAEQSAYVDLIKSATKALSLITDSVLDFSKLENDNSESQAKPTKVDIRKLIYDCVRQCYMRKDHRSLDVTLICIVEDQVPEVCWVDEVYISRVVFNLCGNALKFTSNGYVIMKLSLAEDPQDLMLQCIDTGIGIPQANLEDIFKPFRQVDNENTRKFHGTGLGLAISLQLMEKLGGSMAVKSSQDEQDPERGSCFTCLFPNTQSIEHQAAPGTSLYLPPPTTTDTTRKVSKTKMNHLTYLHRQKHCHPALAAVLRDEFNLHNVSMESVVRATGGIQFSQRILTEIECFATQQLRRIFERCPEDTMWFVCYDEEAAGTMDIDIKALRRRDNVVLLRRPICISEDFFNQLNAMAKIRSSSSFDLNAEMSERVNPVLPVTRDRARDDSRSHTRSVKFDIPALDKAATSSPLDEIELRIPLQTQDQETTEIVQKSDIPTTNSPNELEQFSSAADLGKPSILLVEDNKVNSKLGMIMLKKCGMDAVAAGDGQEALDLIMGQPTRFALVLMDCQMPVMDGLTAIRKIRAWEQIRGGRTHIPIISLTANVSEAAEKECLEAGADKFLPKPLTMKNLQDEVCHRSIQLV